MENNIKKITPSITGYKENHWKSKMKEVEKLGLESVSLFVQRFSESQREKIYNHLETIGVKTIPLVHIRNEMGKKELEYLEKRYNTKYFTIHESGFDYLKKWGKYKNKLHLEMSTDDVVKENVKVEKIGGFCVDLAHYLKQKERGTVDYEYVFKRRRKTSLFRCNHVSSYSSGEMQDLHWVEDEEDFDYLKSLPDFVFGDLLAIEIYDSIERQLKIKKYVEDLI